MTATAPRHHEDLRVWRDSIGLAKQVYQFALRLPAQERFGLVQQLRRAAVSVPANIAEGAARASRKEFLRFISIALGSVSEIDTHLILAAELYGIEADAELCQRVVSIRRMLLRLRAALKESDADNSV